MCYESATTSFGLLVLVLTIQGCGPSEQSATRATPSVPFTVEGSLDFLRADGSPITTIDIEIADDDSTRTRGLMQRTDLPSNAGMLFIFPREEIRSFWMANTPLSLDMLFVRDDGEIVDVHKYTKPFSPQSVTSRVPATYVVEVKAGFTDTWGITETDRIVWLENESP